MPRDPFGPGACRFTGRGGVAHMRPIASGVQQMLKQPSAGGSVRGDPRAALSPGEQRALRRCAPLSTAEFKAVGELIARRRLPLRLLRRRRAAP